MFQNDKEQERGFDNNNKIKKRTIAIQT